MRRDFSKWLLRASSLLTEEGKNTGTQVGGRKGEGPGQTTRYVECRQDQKR